MMMDDGRIDMGSRRVAMYVMKDDEMMDDDG